MSDYTYVLVYEPKDIHWQLVEIDSDGEENIVCRYTNKDQAYKELENLNIQVDYEFRQEENE